MRSRLSALLLLAIVACQAPPRGDVGGITPVTTENAQSRQDSSTAVTTAAPPGNPGDVRFMREMIGHHAQAMVMTALVPSRTSNESLRLLAERIEVSQRDEIARMQHWLRSRGEYAPSAHDHAGMSRDSSHAQHDSAHVASHHGAPPMPGMLSASELDALRSARGRDFETLFLRLMIRHHEGAITMVGHLFGTQGAAQSSEIYQLATDIDGDQRAEIARMRVLLQSLSG